MAYDCTVQVQEGIDHTDNPTDQLTQESYQIICKNLQPSCVSRSQHEKRYQIRAAVHSRIILYNIISAG